MNDTLTDLIGRLRTLEDEIEAELGKRRERAGYLLDRHRVRFEKATIAAHRAMRRSVGRFLRESGALKTLAAPLVYGLIVPIVLLDITVALFQAVCFPVYGIRKVPRGDFVAIDRHHLAYLNPLEKLNCAYCGY
ncbi:MAG: hypothetical protein OQJ99_00965, partial [Rhodospirillales bacterium]|nr:hypothetical protein [Rhodospirillales bacterium]